MLDSPSSIDPRAHLLKGQRIIIREDGRYTWEELKEAYREQTTLEFFGVKCLVVDITFLFFEQEHELEIKAEKPFSQ